MICERVLVEALFDVIVMKLVALNNKISTFVPPKFSGSIQDVPLAGIPGAAIRSAVLL